MKKKENKKKTRTNENFSIGGCHVAQRPRPPGAWQRGQRGQGGQGARGQWCPLLRYSGRESAEPELSWWARTAPMLRAPTRSRFQVIPQGQWRSPCMVLDSFFPSLFVTYDNNNIKKEKEMEKEMMGVG